MQLVAYFDDDSGPGISFAREVLRRLAEYSTRIAEHPVNRIKELLPWNIDAELTGNSRHAA